MNLCLETGSWSSRGKESRESQKISCYVHSVQIFLHIYKYKHSLHFTYVVRISCFPVYKMAPRFREEVVGKQYALPSGFKIHADS